MASFGPVLIVSGAALFGAIAFLLLTFFIAQGAHVYEDQYLGRVNAGLKEAFFLVERKTLFLANILAMIAAGSLVFYMLGIFPAMTAVCFVAVLPTILLHVVRKRRARQFVYQLPDALGAMASSLRAGTSLTRVLEQIATQHPPPVSQEFSIALSEFRMGRELEDSLDALYKRVRKPEVELLNSSVTISRSVGGNLADTFDTLAETIREKLRVEGRIDSLTSMARMQGWVVCLLPFVVGFAIYKQEPESMGSLLSEPVGWMVLGVLSLMMITAILLIRKIINIEV